MALALKGHNENLLARDQVRRMSNGFKSEYAAKPETAASVPSTNIHAHVQHFTRCLIQEQDSLIITRHLLYILVLMTSFRF